MNAEFQRDYLLRLPLPLAQLYSRAYNAKDARARHDNAFYLCEALVKLAAAPAVASYLRETSHGCQRSEALDRLLCQLALPSLGQWLAILRELIRFFGSAVDAARHPLGRLHGQLTQQRNDRPALLALFQRIKNGPDGAPAGDQRCSVMEVLDALVQYRNLVFGHGGPRFDSFFEKEMGPLLFPAVNELLAEDTAAWFGPPGSRFVYLTEIRTVDAADVEIGLRELTGRDGERLTPLRLKAEQAKSLLPNRVAMLWPGWTIPLRLDPLLVYRETDQGEDVLFLNRDRNSRQVEYLSYFSGRTERDASMAPALTALLSTVTGRTVTERQLADFQSESMAETPSVDVLTGEQPLAGRVLGDYELLGELGRGGMGVVYLARQLSLGRLVALKMLPADLTGDEVALARLRREIRALGRCDHPHIVKVLASGVLPDGQPYYTMEYVPGCDLERVWRELSSADGKASDLSGSSWQRAVLMASKKQRVETLKPSADGAPVQELPLRLLPEMPAADDDPGGYVRRVVTLMRDAARAVQAVHDQDLIHRDVKPANLMLTPDGQRVVLMDFGLAKGRTTSRTLSVGGGLLGTLRYAAPEQLAAANVKVGREADVRGLGVTLWELLTRRRLFAEAQDEAQLSQLILGRDVPQLRSIDPTLDRDLEAVVARATERVASDRIASAGQMADYLQMWLDGQSLPIRTPGMGELVRKWVRQRPAVAALLAALVLVTVLGVAGITWKYFDAEEQRRRQERTDTVANLRLAAEVDEQLALAEAKAGRLRPAYQFAEHAAARLADLPELEETRARLDALQRRLQQLVTFYKNLDDAELVAAQTAEHRIGQNTPQVAEAMGALERCLSSLDVLNRPNWWEELPDEDLTPQQKQRLREDIYREILLLAGVQVMEGGTHLFTPRGKTAFRNAQITTAMARRWRDSHSIGALERVCRLGLGEPPPAESAADNGPVTAVDFYVNGIVHLWLSVADRDPAMGTVMPLLRTLNITGVDFKSPLNTAQERLLTATRLDPAHYWTYFWLGASYRQANKLHEAELAFDTCLGLRPEFGAGYMARGQVLISQASVTPNAQVATAVRTRGLTDLGEAIRVDPQLAHLAFTQRGLVYFERGDYDKALADFNEAIDRRGYDAEKYLGRGRTYYQKMQYERAVADYSEVTRRVPKFDIAFYERAMAYHGNGKNDEAIADCTEAIRLNPKGEWGWLYRGHIQATQGRWQKAGDDLGQAVALQRDPAENRLWRQWRGLAILAANQSAAFDRVYVSLKRDHAANPNDVAAALAALGLGVMTPQSEQRAAELVAIAERLAPKNVAYAQALIGAAYYRAGRLQDAAKRLEESVRLRGPDEDPEPLFFLCLARQALQEQDKAQIAFNRAVAVVDRLKEEKSLEATALARFWQLTRWQMLREEVEAKLKKAAP